MGDRNLAALAVHREGLGVAQVRRAGGRVAGVPHGHVADQTMEGVAGEDLGNRQRFQNARAAIDALIDFGFQSPMVQGVDDEWRIQVNSAHLQNVRTWLELIKLNPKRSTRLLSALVIHLAAVIWMVLMQITRSICPLTYLEAWLKSEGQGAEVYSGKFIIETMERLIYVDNVTLEKITYATGVYLTLIVLSFWFRPIAKKKKVL